MVAHWGLFRVYTAKQEFWKKHNCFNEMPTGEYFKSLKNCEFYPDRDNFKI